MASPAEIIPPAPTAPEEFDPLEFWLRYRGRILLYTGVVVLGILLYSAYYVIQTTKREHSEEALANAKTTGDYQKLVDAYPHSAAAGDALLLLADRQRKDGKLDDSNTTLKRFIDGYPKHNLISGAYTGLGANLEAQGKLDDALLQYKKVTTNYPSSFSAASAYMAQGRILQAQGKIEEARHAYETILSQFPESPTRQEAMTMMGKLKK